MTSLVMARRVAGFLFLAMVTLLFVAWTVGCDAELEFTIAGTETPPLRTTSYTGFQCAPSFADSNGASLDAGILAAIRAVLPVPVEVDAPVSAELCQWLWNQDRIADFRLVDFWINGEAIIAIRPKCPGVEL